MALENLIGYQLLLERKNQNNGLIMDLKPGEVICDECKGRGEVIEPFSESHNSYDCLFMTCPKCKGYKKLDWIEVATGVIHKPDLLPF
jgi:Zn finger protein HypA/HybF involved in hydrogenase expression